jgi:hypothetical protein
VSIVQDTASVNPDAVDAFTALDLVLNALGYGPGDAQTYNCRPVVGGSGLSLHAYGIAVDIDPPLNPHENVWGPTDWSRTKFTPAQVDAAKAIRTNNGKQVWTWGGNWFTIKDYMHWQLDVAPADLATGINWSTVIGGIMGWTKPGDPVENVSDADAVFAYQGSFAPGPPPASYEPASLAEANDRVWIVMARITDWIMRHDASPHGATPDLSGFATKSDLAALRDAAASDATAIAAQAVEAHAATPHGGQPDLSDYVTTGQLAEHEAMTHADGVHE